MQCLHQIAVDLRFENIAGRSHILSGLNEVYTLVHRQKDDPGRAPRASQLLRNEKPRGIA